jgi:hypothetical protein
MTFVREASAAVVLVTLTLSLQWDGCGDCLGRTQLCAPGSQVVGDPFHHSRDAINDCVHWFGLIGDSALGGLLSILMDPKTSDSGSHVAFEC